MINLILNTRSFTETLLYDTVLLVFVLIAVYLLSSRGNPRGGGSILRRVGGSGVLNRFVTAASIVVLILSLLPLDSTERTSLYFALQGVLAWIVLTLYVKERVSSSAVIFYTVASLLSIPAVIYFKNMFYPRYDITREALYATGSLEPYMRASLEGGFYYLIPIDPLIMVPLAYICGGGIEPLLPTIRNFALYLVIVLAIFAIIKRRGLKPLYASILAYTIAPTLSFQDRIISLPYATLIIYILLLAISSNTLSSRLAIILTITSLVSVFAHPVGPITLIFTLLFLISLSKAFKYDRVYRASSSVFLTFTLVAFTYWFSTYLYTLLMVKGLRLADATVRFLDSILGRGEAREVLLGYTISSYTSPGYSKPKFYTYAYVWALPIAIATSFLVVSLIKNKKRKNTSEENEVVILGIASSLATVLLIGVAYIGYAMNVEPGQYLIPAGYYASTLAIGTALQKYSKVRKPAFAVLAFLIALGVGLGLHSPNWAPLEHPDFESSIIIRPHTNYIEADLIRDYVDEYVMIYSVYDFPLGAQGKMPNYILDQIRSGNIAKFSGTLIGTRSDEPILRKYPQYINILYSTGWHMLVEICR